MIDTAIILAGGLGTRLAAVVPDLPKPMAPVAGRPFLERLLDRLAAQGIQQVVLAVGHKRDLIRSHFGGAYRGISLRYSEELEPLGTGGALRQAFEQAGLQRAFALNGDTYCTLSLAQLAQAHEQGARAATLALVPVQDAGRYGAVELDAVGQIRSFREKNPATGAGLINAGVYALERRVFEQAPAAARKFSFEQDMLVAQAASAGLWAYVASGALFIDIGVPADYVRAQTLLEGV